MYNHCERTKIGSSKQSARTRHARIWGRSVIFFETLAGGKVIFSFKRAKERRLEGNIFVYRQQQQPKSYTSWSPLKVEAVGSVGSGPPIHPQAGEMKGTTNKLLRPTSYDRQHHVQHWLVCTGALPLAKISSSEELLRANRYLSLLGPTQAAFSLRGKAKVLD